MFNSIHERETAFLTYCIT